MPLISFGAILTFAETIEKENKAYYQKAVSQLSDKDMIAFAEQTVKGKEKQIKVIQRVRRENVSEMILEPIKDFTRGSFLLPSDRFDDISPDGFISAALALEERNLQYYTKAAKKIKALPEVATALKQLAKKQKNLVKTLETMK